MTSLFYKFVPLNPHAERRRLLVEVYNILIEMAEEEEADMQGTTKEKTTEPTPMQGGKIIAPLKSNIPPRR